MIFSMKGTKPQDRFLFGLKMKEIFIIMWPNLATTVYTHYVMLLLVKNLFSSVGDLYFVELNLIFAALAVVAFFVIQWNLDMKNAVSHSGLCTSHKHISRLHKNIYLKHCYYIFTLFRHFHLSLGQVRPYCLTLRFGHLDPTQIGHCNFLVGSKWCAPW